jgi:glycosyltransferase involved in cell wall biosynthesis
MFFPRGGSAHVARALARELPAHGWDVTVVSGSRSPGTREDARDFYANLDVRPVDFDRGQAPLHPSYEDRPGAEDRVFAAVDDLEYERHVRAWSRALAKADAAGADVLHLHHLTPLHEAAARVAPDVPVVGHLHGTELLMLERIADGAPASWRHADVWFERMCRWAARCERVLLLSGTQEARAQRLLGLDPERCTVVPNGFDPDRFKPCTVDREALWRRVLVHEPRGWRPGEPEGSVRYDEPDVRALAHGTILLSVGRFTEVKRVGLLVQAFARARSRFRRPASLVVVGGYPGEWEGEHPAATIERIGARDVFLAGWQDQTQLPELMCAGDAIALASVAEQFGSVLVEAMACGLPAIAVNRYGPSEIVEPGATGWLVAPDDEAALADVLVEAVNDPETRARRGERALEISR